MSGASWRATKASVCGRERFTEALGQCGVADCHKALSRTDCPRHTGVRIATFHRDAPARRGAFVDERSVDAGDGGAER
jgi:hypothetical protein